MRIFKRKNNSSLPRVFLRPAKETNIFARIISSAFFFSATKRQVGREKEGNKLIIPRLPRTLILNNYTDHETYITPKSIGFSTRYRQFRSSFFFSPFLVLIVTLAARLHSWHSPTATRKSFPSFHVSSFFSSSYFSVSVWPVYRPAHVLVVYTGWGRLTDRQNVRLIWKTWQEKELVARPKIQRQIENASEK